MTRPDDQPDAGLPTNPPPAAHVHPPDREIPGAWISLLTTEHYNLQTQRAATISEANGRASVFLSVLSPGLIALGFQASAGARASTTTTFQVLVLSSLVVLGIITFLRCLQISIDDLDFSYRIQMLRGIYRDLVPTLAGPLQSITRDEQSVTMLRPRLQPLQHLLSVPGSIAIISSIVVGADAGVLIYGLHAPLAIAIPAGAALGVICAATALRFQVARWRGAQAAHVTNPMP